MAFKPKTDFTRGREYIVGEGTERIAYDNMVKASKEIEEKKFGPERDTRRSLQACIAEKVIQGWPDEEILKYVEKEFPKDKIGQAKTYIAYWKEKQEKVLKDIDTFVEKIQNGQMTESQAMERLKTVTNRYKLLKAVANNYFTKKIEELREEER